MKLAIIGTGYVGLVTGACFASKGYDVICVDIVADKVRTINEGKSPIFEKGLDEMLKDLVSKKKLQATLDIKNAVTESDLIFICVGTPTTADGQFNYSYLKQAAKQIGSILKETNEYKVIIIKSTCTPGTTSNVILPILEEASGKKVGEGFGLGFNPEFLREGVAVEDFFNPDRIVIGGEDTKSIDKIRSVYEDFNSLILEVDPTTAEMIKIASNSFLAMKISFINEMANIAEKIGSDIKNIATGIGLDHRISDKFLRAGLGWGGSCFPKDVRALYQQSKELGVPSKLIDATIQVNKKQPLRSVEMLEEELKGSSLKGKKIVILGLAFKPDTDDMREAVSIPIINGLLEKKAIVHVHDPAALENAKIIFDNKNFHYELNPVNALTNADGCILVTEWKEYARITPEEFVSLMKTPIVIDGRRFYDPKKMREAGVRYLGIGLGKKNH